LVLLFVSLFGEDSLFFEAVGLAFISFLLYSEILAENLFVVIRGKMYNALRCRKSQFTVVSERTIVRKDLVTLRKFLVE
jgi:hypothetical protein